MNEEKLAIHPGKYLLENFLKPYDIGIQEFADLVGCTRKHMSQVVNGDARMLVDMAKKISIITTTDALYWLRLQDIYDLSLLDEKDYEYCYERAPEFGLSEKGKVRVHPYKGAQIRVTGRNSHKVIVEIKKTFIDPSD